MDFWYALIVMFMFVSVQADEYKPVSIQFSTDPGESVVLEGAKVTLTCPKIPHRVVYITFSNSKKLGENQLILFDSSNSSHISSKYNFNETDDNTYAFSIKKISRDDEGSYRCLQTPDIRTSILKVLYSPSRSPQCSSNYRTPIIFFDEIEYDLVFNCSTETGNPPVITEIYVDEHKVTSDLEIIHETRAEKDVVTNSLSVPPNDTLQNSVFVCNVTQQLPSPYNNSYYQGSCSFGPLHILSGFSLSVSPSNITINEGDSVTLTCVSNLTGVKITWINIPSEKYSVENDSQSSVLNISAFQPELKGAMYVTCRGSYGSRTITANTSVILVLKEEQVDDEKHTLLPLSVKIILFILISIFVLVVSFIIWKKRNKKDRRSNVLEITSMSNHHEEVLTTSEERNVNNANNTALCSKVEGMCDNIIYEPASYLDKTVFDAEDGSYRVGNYPCGEDHVICENVIYQPL